MMKCFVISRIGEEGSDEREHADTVLEHIIEPCFDDTVTVIRADQDISPNLIKKSIIKNISEADIVIADLTGNNPNVFYELAVSHTLGKPTIQILEKGNDIPFDVNDMRTVFYSMSIKDAKQTKKQLRSHIESALKNPKMENPILEVIGYNEEITKKLMDTSTEVKKGYGELEEVLTLVVEHYQEYGEDYLIEFDYLMDNLSLSRIELEVLLGRVETQGFIEVYPEEVELTHKGKEYAVANGLI